MQIAQKTTSLPCLNAIISFLSSLQSNSLSSYKGNLHVSNIINKRTNVASLIISSVDSLYYYILPFLDKYPLHTFKRDSFLL